MGRCSIFTRRNPHGKAPPPLPGGGFTAFPRAHLRAALLGAPPRNRTGTALASATTTSTAQEAPNPTGLAERYALALLGIIDDLRATEPGAADRIAADLDALFQLWRNDAGFRSFVGDPRLDSLAQRRGAFAIIERAGIGTEVRNLVGVLPSVAAAFGAQLATRRGQQTAKVTTAHALSDTQRAQIVARLTEAGFSGVKLHETVDPALLGGLVVRIGSRLYDNSIKSKLQRLQYAMKGAA
jgi:F-type H+-transporting ATPase subunit delta